jgi:mannose-6-phosphate isomerase-like protein (cupin superfamily)
MRYSHYSEFPAEVIGVDAPGATRRMLNDVETSVQSRFIEVSPGGHTLRHSHPYEHTFYILEGKGEIVDENGVSPLNPGVILYVKPGELHVLNNTGEKPLRFLDVKPTPRKEEKKV